MQLHLNDQGFITNWLVSGPVCTAYHAPEGLPPGSDQLAYEKTLRGAFYSTTAARPQSTISLGATSPLEAPWQYWYHHSDQFVDTSSFYGLLTRIEVDAVTEVTSPKAQTVRAVLWTYAAIELWAGDTKVVDAEAPVYKPIRKVEFELPLEKGATSLYLRMQNLGIRDTRNLFALQLPTNAGLAISLPGGEATNAAIEAEHWLQGLRLENGTLHVPAAPPAPALLELPTGPTPIEAAGEYTIPTEVRLATVAILPGQERLERPFELLEHSHPIAPTGCGTDHHKAFYTRLGQSLNEPRGEGTFFSVFHVLARLATTGPAPGDEALLLNDLDIIETCRDCADFLVIGFVRLLNKYPVSEAVAARAKEVLLGFRYWMDEPGSDGMCFWSENHALMFYGSQMAVGALYPDDTFTRSGRTGAEQHAIGAARCESWLEDVEANGVDEFNSASYMPVTLAALLNLVDFAPEPIANRAAAFTDRLMRQLCLHVFGGSVISPQGRVYRDVIYPYRQSVQSVLHMIDASLPWSNTECMWNACFATSRYTFPEGLRELMAEQVDTNYTSGNARIHLQKTAHTMLTSVESPRGEADAPEHVNLCFEPNADKNTYAYIKSLNERYHGTNVFRPGVDGYQQHLWYAALSCECVVFTTHPGSAVDLDHMRPGYWYGNGVFPAVHQQGDRLAAIYEIPAKNPIRFTHAFWPTSTFDEWRQQGNWLVGKKGYGYVGLWCSGPLIPHDDVLAGCEFRCYDEKAAYLCLVGSGHESLDAFEKACAAATPTYDAASGTLEGGMLKLTYTAYADPTQVI